MESPCVIVLAGPNGAGKSTISQALLAEALQVPHFVNADVIARGLSGFRSEEMAFKAGRVMLDHLRELAAVKETFAFETTLATRSFAPWIQEIKAQGYRFHLYYLYLPSAEMAVERVHRRKQQGGHFVPEPDVHRRYERGLSNFFNLYAPFADFWQLFDNTEADGPRLIAQGVDKMKAVFDAPLWKALSEKVRAS